MEQRPGIEAPSGDMTDPKNTRYNTHFSRPVDVEDPADEVGDDEVAQARVEEGLQRDPDEEQGPGTGRPQMS
ncbi:MAG TPA: hypothetical protein VFG88_13090 [Nocardioidaceae bacterium]|jgi:hypothetical protein|nr:hypothetical protein [Nocardioidaceae bacterium]